MTIVMGIMVDTVVALDVMIMGTRGLQGAPLTEVAAFSHLTGLLHHMVEGQDGKDLTLHIAALEEPMPVDLGRSAEPLIGVIDGEELSYSVDQLASSYINVRYMLFVILISALTSLIMLVQ